MPPLPRPKNTTNEATKEKSGIPLKESSKTITKRQSKLPAATSRLKTTTPAAALGIASSSKNETPMHSNPMTLRFGGSKSSAAASRLKTKTQTAEKKTPVVIDIDIDSEDEDKTVNQPQAKSTAEDEATPMSSSSSSSTRKTSKKPLREEIDWKSRCSDVEKQLQERELTIQQLDVKIPNMIDEFQKCVTNKDNILGQKDQKLKEYKAALEEKEKLIVKLEAEKKASVKNRNVEAQRKIESLKEEVAVKVKEINILNEKLRDSVTTGNKRQEELREKNKECSEKTKLIMELEGLKPKLKSQVEVIAKLEKEKDDKMEQIECFNKEMKSQSLREEDYRARIEKLKEENEDCKQKNQEMKVKMTFLEADLSLHFNLVEEKDEEIRTSKENLGKLENEKKSIESNIRKSEEEKESLQSQLKASNAELKSAKKALVDQGMIQNKIGSLKKTIETQNEIIRNQKVALEEYPRKVEELGKRIKAQSLKTQLANESQSKFKNENKVQADRIKKLNEENNQLKVLLNNEVQNNKKTQDLLCGQLNALEVQNFNKKEIIGQLEAELKSLKEEKKRSIQFISLKDATEEYSEMVKRRQVEHLTHEFCSDAQIENTTSQEVDPVTLDEDSSSLLSEEPMLIVDTSYEEEEEEEIIYIDENPLQSPENEVIIEDADEDYAVPPSSGQKLDVSYPNNMLTYLWPCLPWVKNYEKGRREEDDAGVLLQSPETSSVRISSYLFSACGNSGPETPRDFLRCSTFSLPSVRPPTKRKCAEIVASPSKRVRYTEDIIRIQVPSPTLAITYNWPLMVYQGNLLSHGWTQRERRGIKRSRDSQDEGLNPNKRIKLDWNASYFPGPSSGLVNWEPHLFSQLRTLAIAASQNILDDLIIKVLSVSQHCERQESRGVVVALIENVLEHVLQLPQPQLKEKPDWPIVPYMPGRFNSSNAPMLEATAVSSTDQNIIAGVVEGILEKLLTIVANTVDTEEVRLNFPISSSSEHIEISTEEKDGNLQKELVEEISGKICEELLLKVLESEKFEKSGQVSFSFEYLMFY